MTIRPMPIPIQTNQGVVHMYFKYNQLPIIGTHMTKPRDVVIIITETKKYCGFASSKTHILASYKKYYSDYRDTGDKYFEISKPLRILTEFELLKFPSESTKQFNMRETNDSVIPGICIDFVSYPRTKYSFETVFPLEDERHDESRISEYEWVTRDPMNEVKTYTKIQPKDLLVNFELRLYEYDDFNQDTEMINSGTFDHPNPKLERTLKMLWKLEQGIDITASLKPHINDKPPKYETSVQKIEFSNISTEIVNK